MDSARLLERHALTQSVVWRVGELEVPLCTKVGVRGFPGVDGALVALADALRRERLPLRGRVLDLTGAPAALPAWAHLQGVSAAWTVATSSAATRRAAEATLETDAFAGGRDDVEVVVALPWEVPGRFDTIVWRPPADRGTLRVAAELAAVAERVTAEGTVWALQHKDEGAKRGERAAAERFDDVAVVARTGGWRLAALRGPRPGPEPTVTTSFDAADGAASGVAGAFAAQKEDLGTAVLLRSLLDAPVAGARVLDLGCGTGLLARRALQLGAAEVVAVDDDLAAVRSAERQLAGDARARVHHGDLLDGLGPLGFDAVWCNPPFHVGRQVVGDLSRAFVAAAHAALRPGGEAWFVANRALPYEAELAPWAAWGDATPAGERAFKVLWARRAP